MLLILGGNACRGQEPVASSAIDTLDAASVTDLAARSISPVRTLSGEQLQGLSSTSVADALRYFSGVQIKDYGGIGGLKTVNVRSLGAQHVGIFYDGIKIENAQNGQVDLGRFSLDNMEEVSVYNAQKSDALQSASDYAAASSVYLRTRVPVFGDEKTHMMARIKYGSFNTFNPSMRIEQRIGKASLTADAMYLKTDGNYKFRISNQYEDTTALRANGDVEAARAELGLFARPFGGDLQVHAYGYASERGLPGPVVRRLSDQFSSTDRQWDRNLFIQASWKKTGEKAAALINAKGSSDWLQYDSAPGMDPASIHIHNTYLQRSLYSSAAISWYPTKWISTNIAVDGRLSDLDCDVMKFEYVQRRDLKSALAATFRHAGFSGQTSLLHTYISDHTRGSAKPLSKLTPTLLLGWSSDRVSTRAFYKSIFRAPTLNDLYYTFVGNVSLQPEFTKQWNLGGDWRFLQKASLEAKLSMDLYYNEIHDKIVAMPVSSQFRWSMMNFGLVKGYGAELTLTGHMDRGRTSFDTRMSYTYERAMDCSYPDSHWYKGQLPYTPQHSGSAILAVTHEGWRANLSGLFTGVRYSTSDNTRSSRMSPWMTVDMTISHTLKVRETEFDIGIDINNLLNQRYEVVTRYPMPGTNALLKLTIKI